MSRLNLSPNYCSCTVTQARNLPNKGKANGIDPFCTISMGKEKFVTAVREKTSSPDWHEQCDMAIVDDATIKLTVYHNSKSALSKGDFIGRAYVTLRDLQDYDRVITNWYRLSNKEGKMDKDRGEIEVSLQFYSKNNNTGSVLDLATKKKHLSLKDIKHSLGSKLKSASKQKKNDQYDGENQLGDQRRRLGGAEGSMYNVPDFLDDSASETTSYAGSHMSLNSMSSNNQAGKQKKISHLPPPAPAPAPSGHLGPGTPHSASHRSVTSDYDTSSILDSASMYGADEPSTPSPPVRVPKQSSREVYVGDDLPAKTTSEKKKAKDPSPSMTMPTIITSKPVRPFLTTNSRSSSITGDDVEAAFDAAFDEPGREHPTLPSPNALFGLSTITESLDPEEKRPQFNSKPATTDDEMDFDSYFNKSTPTLQELKSSLHTHEQSRLTLNQSSEILTPSVSLTTRVESNSLALSDTQQTENLTDDIDESVDEDVEELLGKLERMSSIRSSVKRKIQPQDDPMQQSMTESESKLGGFFHKSPSIGKRSETSALPDILSERTAKGGPSTVPTIVKPANSGLSVLGYDDVKSTPINPRIRQELDYLDREELLHVIAHQSDLLRKRDTRLKDLESYTDGLLVKIVEQCPTILQNGTIKSQMR